MSKSVAIETIIKSVANRISVISSNFIKHGAKDQLDDVFVLDYAVSSAVSEGQTFISSPQHT